MDVVRRPVRWPSGSPFTFPNPIIILILLLGAFDTYRRWKALKPGGEEARSYYRVSPRTG